MRAKEFTYQKTKKVKTITKFQGISLDLTVQEAADLKELLGNVGTGSLPAQQLFTGLYQELCNFLRKNGSPTPTIRCGFMSAPSIKSGHPDVF